MTYAKAPAGVLNSIEYNIDTVIVTNGETDMQRFYWLNSTYLDLAKATNTTMQGSPETMVYDNCRTLCVAAATTCAPSTCPKGSPLSDWLPSTAALT